MSTSVVSTLNERERAVLDLAHRVLDMLGTQKPTETTPDPGPASDLKLMVMARRQSA